jgi:hypothetical protein
MDLFFAKIRKNAGRFPFSANQSPDSAIQSPDSELSTAEP